MNDAFKDKKFYQKLYKEQIADGLSQNAIAKKYDIAMSTYSSGIRRHGIKKTPSRKYNRKVPIKTQTVSIPDPTPQAPVPVAVAPQAVEAPKNTISVVLIKGDATEVAETLKKMF